MTPSACTAEIFPGQWHPAHGMAVINVGGHYSAGCRKALHEAPDGYNFLVVHRAMMGGKRLESLILVMRISKLWQRPPASPSF